MKTLIDTATRTPVHEIAPGDVFQLVEGNIHNPHVRIASNSPHLSAVGGRVYSLQGGIIHEHDPETIVFIMTVSKA